MGSGAETRSVVAPGLGWGAPLRLCRNGGRGWNSPASQLSSAAGAVVAVLARVAVGLHAALGVELVQRVAELLGAVGPALGDLRVEAHAHRVAVQAGAAHSAGAGAARRAVRVLRARIAGGPAYALAAHAAGAAVAVLGAEGLGVPVRPAVPVLRAVLAGGAGAATAALGEATPVDAVLTGGALIGARALVLARPAEAALTPLARDAVRVARADARAGVVQAHVAGRALAVELAGVGHVPARSLHAELAARAVAVGAAGAGIPRHARPAEVVPLAARTVVVGAALGPGRAHPVDADIAGRAVAVRAAAAVARRADAGLADRAGAALGVGVAAVGGTAAARDADASRVAVEVLDARELGEALAAEAHQTGTAVGVPPAVGDRRIAVATVDGTAGEHRRQRQRENKCAEVRHRARLL